MKSAFFIFVLIASSQVSFVSAQQLAKNGTTKASTPITVKKKPLKARDSVPLFALKQFGGDFVFLKNYCGPSRKEPAVKAVLLDFFATDCLPCVAKLPGLQALGVKYAAKGLKTILISTDKKPEQVLPGFIAAKNVNLPVLTDLYGKTLSNYGFKSIPQTVLVDSGCKAAYVVEPGEKTPSVLEGHVKTLLE